MQISQEQIDSLWCKFYTIGAKALLIRDFWKGNTDTLTINFDSSVNKDPWLIYKFEAFNTMWARKPTDGYIRVGEFSTGLGGVDTLYKELIYGVYEGEYIHTLQNKEILSILDNFLLKYPENSYIDIFSFSHSDEDKLEYLETTNPLLSLLRLEYEGLIEIQDILLFSFPRRKKDNFFIRGKVSFKKVEPHTSTVISMTAIEKTVLPIEIDKDIVRINKNLEYSTRTGVFTHIQSQKKYELGSTERSKFINCIIGKGLDGMKAQFIDVAIAIGKCKAEHENEDVNSHNKDTIRDIGKNIQKSLQKHFGLSSDEVKFYITKGGFRFNPYKPE